MKMEVQNQNQDNKQESWREVIVVLGKIKKKIENYQKNHGISNKKINYEDKKEKCQ